MERILPPSIATITMELTDLKREAQTVMQRLGKAQEYL